MSRFDKGVAIIAVFVVGVAVGEADQELFNAGKGGLWAELRRRLAGWIAP